MLKVYSIKYLTKMTSPSWKQVGGYNRTGNYARFSYLTNETDSDKYSTSATSVAYTLGSLPTLVTFNTLPGLAYTPGQKNAKALAKMMRNAASLILTFLNQGQDSANFWRTSSRSLGVSTAIVFSTSHSLTSIPSSINLNISMSSWFSRGVLLP